MKVMISHKGRLETRRLGRSGTILLTVLGAVAVLIGFASWAVSSPVAGSPDDDYHLGSIWCPRPIEDSGCEFRETNGTITAVKVPDSILNAQDCFAFKPEQNASCALSRSDDRSGFTERFDAGAYPWGYYQLHHLFVGPDVHRSVVTMRLVNIVLGIGGLIGVALVAPRGMKDKVIMAAMVAWVPMGVYFIASNNPSSWAISGCLIYATGMLSALEAEGPRRWGLLALSAYGAVLAATSRADSAFFLAVITLAVWFFTRFTRARIPALVISLCAAAVGLLIMVNSGQAGNLKGDGGWPVTEGSVRFILSKNLQQVPEFIASMWGLTWGPGWFDVPLRGWSTLTMVFLAGGLVMAGAAHVDLRKFLASGVILGALVGVPVVSLTLRHVQPVIYYQGRYMLPLLAVLFFFWLQRGRWAPMRTPGQMALLVVVVAVANGSALRRILLRYTVGLDSSFSVEGLEDPQWWPWSVGPSVVWITGAFAMAVGLALLLFVATRQEEDISHGRSLVDR